MDNLDTVADLAARYFDKLITPDDFAALCEHLATDPAARRHFNRMSLHSRLLRAAVKDQGSGIGGQGSGIRLNADAEPALGRSVWYEKGFRVQGSGVSFKPAGALAALLALAAALLFVFLPSTPHSPLPAPHAAAPASFAILSDLSDDAAFADGDLSLGEGLTAPIKLTAGKAQLMFQSTAVVDLTGPCELEMTGPNRGRLMRGSLDAFVPKDAHGFTVDLPGAVQVVDLGTAFNIHVDDHHRSTIHVTQGRVAVEYPDASGMRPLNLAAADRLVVVTDASDRIVTIARQRVVIDDPVEPNSGWSDNSQFNAGFGLTRPIKGASVLNMTRIEAEQVRKTFDDVHLSPGVYTVTFQVHNYRNHPSMPPGLTAALQAGPMNLDDRLVTSDTPTPAPGQWVAWTLTYDIAADDARLGMPLSFVITDRAGQGNGAIDHLEVLLEQPVNHSPRTPGTSALGDAESPSGSANRSARDVRVGGE
ncbi:MAG: hypothetical protein GC162_02030 [Planctomycetes bacterium]|nr:hypothetical protein [Planctomycetota bacterium]